MRTLAWSSTFIRAYKRTIKKHPELKSEIEASLRRLVANPFDPRLATHKLKGKLADSWACSAGYDCRIIFDFVSVKGQQEEELFLIEIGTHDEVY